MKGVKMRISGLNAKALQVFGGVPTMVTAPEGYTALERGTIDSFGFPYSYAFGAYKMYEVSKYSTEGMAMSGFMCWQGVSTSAYDKLPDEVKKALPTCRSRPRKHSSRPTRKPIRSGFRSSKRSSRSSSSRPRNEPSWLMAPPSSGTNGSKSRKPRAARARRCSSSSRPRSPRPPATNRGRSCRLGHAGLRDRLWPGL